MKKQLFYVFATLAVLVLAFVGCEEEAPPVAVTGVTLDTEQLTLLVDDTETLTATVTPADAANVAVSWSSDRESVATVNSSGKVTAIGEGRAVVTATTEDGGFEAACLVLVELVKVNVKSVSLNKDALTLAAGNSEKLTTTIKPNNATNKKVSWKSSDTLTATVNNKGVVTGVNQGVAHIVVTTKDRKRTDTCVVTVTPEIPVTGVMLNTTDTTLAAGRTFTLTPAVEPGNATNKKVTWKSSSPAIATVNSAGLVTAVAAGAATITATTQNGGFTAACHLSITGGGGSTAGALEFDDVIWAATNVDDYQSFAARPDMYTKFYQWNRSTAWAATGEEVTGWPNVEITDPLWTNNPCPAGWRVPIKEEWRRLYYDSEKGTWAVANTRGNAVAGTFFGPNHASCSLPSNMSGCIFVPAVGGRSFYTGSLSEQGHWGIYWSSSHLTLGSSTSADDFEFNSSGMGDGGWLSFHDKRNGHSVRCVKSWIGDNDSNTGDDYNNYPTLVVDGVEWAATNVYDYQAFAVRPDMYTTFYQWNRNKAWPPSDPVFDWTHSNITDTSWTINPCPAGWRIPTVDEWNDLRYGSSWADANTRGNAVPGRFFGPESATCSLPSNMSGCIFMPAVGARDDGYPVDRGKEGYYWTSSNDDYEGMDNYAFYLGFKKGGASYVGSWVKGNGLTLRCVR